MTDTASILISPLGVASLYVGDVASTRPNVPYVAYATFGKRSSKTRMLFEGAVLQGSHPAGLRPAYRSRSRGCIRHSGFA